LSEIREARLQKANSLVSKGFPSYAESFRVSHTTKFLIRKFDYLENGQEKILVFLLPAECWQKG